MAMQIGSSTPATAEVWSRTRRGLQRNTAVRTQVLSTARELTILDDAGQPVTRLAFLASADPIRGVIERIARGLYFLTQDSALPASTPIDCAPLTTAPAKVGALRYGDGWGGAFRYWYGIEVDDLETSLWLFCLHETTWFQAITGTLIALDAAEADPSASEAESS